MVDPTGHFCISAIIIGAIVGAVIGASIVGYQDYKDDGKIFNGSKTVGNYLMGAAVGGVVGAAAGTAVAAAAGGTAATAGLSALGKAAVSAGSAGAIGAGTNAAIQAASKGITNVDGKEAALAGVKSAAVAFVYSGLGSLAKGSGAGQSLYDSKGSPSPGKAVQDNSSSPGQGFDSYRKLKTYMGSPGEGNEWHHIVEQSQIKKSGFASEIINNTNNIIAVDKVTHRLISGYYSTKSFAFTSGLSVRDWLAGQSFEEQYEFGKNVLNRFGVLK